MVNNDGRLRWTVALPVAVASLTIAEFYHRLGPARATSRRRARVRHQSAPNACSSDKIFPVSAASYPVRLLTTLWYEGNCRIVISC